MAHESANLTDRHARPLTEGERWSRDLLDRLRAGRFRPGAWRRFLSDSAARAQEVRGRRPALARQSRRWGAVGAAAALPFGPRAVGWWAVWWAMLDWHLGMAETPDGRLQRLRAHDALTLARLWAAPVVRRHPEPWLVVAGMATDALDGALARRAGPTRLGRDFDSTADTAFLAAALRGAVDRHGLDPRLVRLEWARLAVGTAITFGHYFGASRPAPVQERRAPGAVLATVGALLAVSGRTRVAAPVLVAASGFRIVTRVVAR